MKICSFLPSATEILYAIGAGDQIVGRSDDSTYPPAVNRKPIAASSRVAQIAGQDSVKIHEAVAKLKRAGEHQFAVHLPVLQKLQPDLIITQNLCTVCAVSHPETLEAVYHLSKKPKVLSLQAGRLDEIVEEIRLVGRAAHRGPQADRLVKQLQGRIQKIRKRLDGISSRPRVWCCEWLEPLMAAGHWVPELVELAGGVSCLTGPGQKSRWLDWKEVRQENPEVIIVMPCSYSLPQIRKEKWRLTERPGWKDLKAVRNKRVFAVETGPFHQFGPRLVDGLEIFAHLFHPDRLPAGRLQKYFRAIVSSA